VATSGKDKRGEHRFDARRVFVEFLGVLNPEKSILEQIWMKSTSRPTGPASDVRLNEVRSGRDHRTAIPKTEKFRGQV
jgi:hypothetical protein